MKTLRLSGFGMRGFVGESLTPVAAMNYASAFATALEGGRALLARDTRASSGMIASAARSALLGAGCEVLDLGVCPPPVLQFSVPRERAAGGLAISGGHHSAGWNALMLFDRTGACVEPRAGEQILDIFHGGVFLRRGASGLGAVREAGAGIAEEYFRALEGFLDAAAIRASGFRILMDPVGGSGCAFLAPFARRFGVGLTAVNGEPSGYLSREPEPRPRSARPLAPIVRALGADAGFVFSSDMSRMSLVTEAGEPASEECTFALLARHRLAVRPGPVVTNCCTSRRIDDIAREAGARVVKTPVGQAHVVAALADENGALGGEGSGSVAVPEFGPVFDGFLMAGLVLEAMARSGRPLSALLEELPRYHIVKRVVRGGAGRGLRALEAVRDRFLAEGGALDETDGLRMDLEDGWAHVRASRTEPIVRVLSESVSADRAAARAEALCAILEQIG